MLRHMREERATPSVLHGYAADCSYDFTLHHAFATHRHRRSVHEIAYMESPLHLLYLLIALYLAHLGYGHHQVGRYSVVDLLYRHSQEGRHIDKLHTPELREIMYRASLAAGRSNGLGQSCRRRSMFHTYTCRQIHKSGYRPCPHHLVYCDIIAIERIPVVVNIYNGCQTGVGKPEIIEKRRILAKGSCVIGEINRHIGIAGKQNNTASYHFTQRIAAGNISLCRKHNILF